VSDHPAEICLFASLVFARIHTIVILTGLILGTILVHLTLALSAFDTGVTKGSSGALAGETGFSTT